MLGSARAARGSVRFGALFKDYVILPVKEYSQLKEVRRLRYMYGVRSHMIPKYQVTLISFGVLC